MTRPQIPPAGYAPGVCAGVSWIFTTRFLLLAIFALSTNAHGDTRGPPPWPRTTPPSPYFLPSGNRNVTTSKGQTAYLHCRVAHLPEMAQVSWIRKRDLHVMSSGMVVFASDQRFQVLHTDKSENWTLQIKFAQVRDAGIYECQVNTEPKMFMAFNLNVIESVAKLSGPEYVMAGSTINLTCTLSQHYQGLVYWYHDKEMLDYEGQVSINTHELDSSGGMRSELVILEAQSHHSGNYSC